MITKPNYYKIFGYILIPVNIVLIVLLILNYFLYLPSYWNSIYVFYLFLIINTCFLALKIKRIPESEREDHSMVYLSKYFFILGLILLAVNQFLKKQILIDYNNYIIGLIIALGFLTFYSSKERVEKEIEYDKQKEEDLEKKRKEEFASKFPFINKIPVLRSIIKWCYKEGGLFSIFFILTFIFFILLKISIPLIYTGSYVDEYNHITSGIEIFKTGHFAEIYSGEYYNRGAYVSFLLGLFFRLFGQTIFIAKMLPAVLGIINFLLLYNLSKNLLTKKYSLLLLIIYTSIPWFIINHFYIRFFVFYEFFILILSILFISIIKNLNSIKKFSINSILILIILGIIYFFGKDSGEYFILLYSFMFLSYIFFFEIQKISLNNNLFENLKKNTKLKIIIYIITFIILFFIFNSIELIKTLYNGSFSSTSGTDYKYYNLFFNLNLIFTVLFFLTIIPLFSKKTKKIYKILILSSVILFLLHYFSSLDFQITRAIIYFLPLFYLISIRGLFFISKSIKIKSLVLILILLIGFSIYNNYPDKFFKEGPYIPTEIQYLDYKKAYDLVSTNQNNRIISIDSAIYSSLIYTDKKVYLLVDNKNPNTKDLIERKKLIWNNTLNQYWFSLDIPVLEYAGQDNGLKNDYIIVRQAYILLNSPEIKEIEQNHDKINLQNIIVYVPKNKY